MKFNRLVFPTILSLGIITVVEAAQVSPVLERFKQDFATPPESTRPGCYWYWFDDNVSKEGISRDLEAMKRVGIGTAMIGIIGGVNGKKASLEPKPLTDAWWENIVHAVK